MHISKHYEENAQIGNFLFTKIGLTIHSDKELKSVEEIEKHSSALNHLAKKIVKQELEEAKAQAKREE